MNQQSSHKPTSVDHIEFASTNPEVVDTKTTEAIERLRASRDAYLRDLTEDARRTGAGWLREHASYAELKYVLWLKASGTSRERLHRAFAEAPLDQAAPRIKAISEISDWSRNWRWYSAFLEGVLAEWNKIAPEVEQD